MGINFWCKKEPKPEEKPFNTAIIDERFDFLLRGYLKDVQEDIKMLITYYNELSKRMDSLEAVIRPLQERNTDAIQLMSLMQEIKEKLKRPLAHKCEGDND